MIFTTQMAFLYSILRRYDQLSWVSVIFAIYILYILSVFLLGSRITKLSIDFCAFPVPVRNNTPAIHQCTHYNGTVLTFILCNSLLPSKGRT